MKDKEKIKVIVLEGIDRSGKTSTIQTLSKKYRSLGYDVHTLWDEQKESIDVLGWARHHFSSRLVSKALQRIDNHFHYDLFSVGNFEMIYRLIRTLYRIEKETSRKQVLIVDRLFFSPYIYGTYFRNEQFTSVWGEDSEKYWEFCSALDSAIDSYANMVIFIVVKNEMTYDGWLDDNHNMNQSVSAQQQKEINHRWKDLYASIIYDGKTSLAISDFRLKVFELKHSTDSTFEKIDRYLSDNNFYEKSSSKLEQIYKILVRSNKTKD